jgi:hypothetical protein
MEAKITHIDWTWFPEKYNDIIVHFSDNQREVCRMRTMEIGEMDSLSSGAVRDFLIYVYMYTGEVEHYAIVEKSTDIVTNIKQYKQKYGTK